MHATFAWHVKNKKWYNLLILLVDLIRNTDLQLVKMIATVKRIRSNANNRDAIKQTVSIGLGIFCIGTAKLHCKKRRCKKLT